MFKKTLYLLLGLGGGYLGMQIPFRRAETLTSQVVGFMLAFSLSILIIDHSYHQWRERRRRCR